jgi:AcrR family transcriptional regulator
LDTSAAGSDRTSPDISREGPGAKGPARATSAARRAQIVEATIRLVGRHGISGTTIGRIAREVGLSDMAAYRHFANKTEILSEAHQHLINRAIGWMRSSSHPVVIERLREVGQAHVDMLSADVEMYGAPMLQFMMTPQEDPFKEAQLRQVSEIADFLVQIVSEGKAQGSIRGDLDPYVFAHLWSSWAMAEDAHYLAAGKDRFFREPHLRMLDLILYDISTGGAGIS